MLNTKQDFVQKKKKFLFIYLYKKLIKEYFHSHKIGAFLYFHQLEMPLGKHIVRLGKHIIYIFSDRNGHIIKTFAKVCFMFILSLSLSLFCLVKWETERPKKQHQAFQRSSLWR